MMACIASTTWSFAIFIELRSNGIASFFTLKLRVFIILLHGEMMRFFAVVHYTIPHPSKKSAQSSSYGAYHSSTCNYVSRNHGITGCPSCLMPLQGVPNRIISLVWAPRELVSPLCKQVNRARHNLMSNCRQLVCQTVSFGYQPWPIDRENQPLNDSFRELSYIIIYV